MFIKEIVNKYKVENITFLTEALKAIYLLELRSFNVDERTLFTGYHLANTLTQQEKFNEAEAIFREVYSLSHEVLGNENVNTLVIAYGLGLILFVQNKYEDSERIIKEIFALTSTIEVKDPKFSEEKYTKDEVFTIIGYTYIFLLDYLGKQWNGNDARVMLYEINELMRINTTITHVSDT